MDEWVAWVIVAVVFAVGEILTLGFFLGPFALAAAVAAILLIAEKTQAQAVSGLVLVLIGIPVYFVWSAAEGNRPPPPVVES